MIIENGVLVKVENSDIKSPRTLTKDGIELTVEIPKEVKVISTRAFAGVYVHTVRFTRNLERIEDRAFANSAIRNVYLDELGKSSSGVFIPATVKEIGSQVFEGCENIKQVFVDCEKIGQSAFEKCENLKVARLGRNVKYIGNYAFYNDTKLRSFLVYNAEFDKEKSDKVFVGRGIFSFNEENAKNFGLPKMFMEDYVNPNQNEHGETQGNIKEGHISYYRAEHCI